MSQQTMPEEGGFLRRWARRKAEAAAGTVPAPAPAAVEAADAVPVVDAAPTVAVTPVESTVPVAQPLPTMADVAQLTRDSDFSAFVARGVDADVRRSALKKLFADPHFNNIDRLDVYMDDYTKPSPVSEAMLAGLQHAKSVFRRPEPEEAEEDVAASSAPAETDASAAAVTGAGPAAEQPALQEEPEASAVGAEHAPRVAAAVPAPCP